jgi:hypothetical protein
MTTQTLEMSNSAQSPTGPLGLLRRLILLVAFTAGIVFWMSVLYRYQTHLSQFLMMVFADIAVALAAGLGARLTLYGRHWFIRFLAALFSLVLGLYALGFLTHWGIGIGPIESWQKRIEWLEVAQLVAGLAIVLLGLTAWRRPSTRMEEIEVEEEPAPARATSNRQRRTRTSSPKLPRFHLPASWTSASRSSSSRNGRLKVKKKARANGRTPAAQERVVVARPVKSARSRRRKAAPRKPELQLSVYEEHRCPYCLEEVKRNDPRGVKECEICHTLHHADCWNVTGMCQIPHLNSLNL